MGNKHMTPELCIAARTMLGWKQEDLASASGVKSRQTVTGYEQKKTLPHHLTLDALQRAFLRAGIKFTGGDEPPGLQIIELQQFELAKKTKSEPGPKSKEPAARTKKPKSSKKHEAAK
jgi:transcriptional regulator with XRE-family HTH domain